MISTYLKLFDLLDLNQRRRFYILLAMIVAMGLFDMFGVAAILPFLAVVADPGIIETNWLLGLLHDWIAPSSQQSFLITLGGMVLGLLLVGLIVKSTTLYALIRFAHRCNETISTRLLKGYLGQPYVWFLNRHTAQLGETMLLQVDRVVGEGLIPALRILAQGVTLTCLIGLLLLVEPSVALTVAGLIGGLYALIFFGIRRMLSRLGIRRARSNSARYKVAQEATGGIKEVKLYGLEETYLHRYRVPMHGLSEAASTAQLIGEMPRTLLETIAFGGVVALVLGLLMRGTGNLLDIVPTLGLFAAAGLRMFPAIQQIYNSLTQMRFVGTMLDNVHRDMAETRTSQLAAAPVPVAPLPLRQELTLRDLHYSYPGARQGALHGLDLTIAARSTVGIVGGTGAGKTTAVDVILGLLAPDRGAVVVDGVPVTSQNRRAWQNALGYVPQSIYLVDDTVAANIAFGIPEQDRDAAAIERAARLAELHDFVMDELAAGYDTPVGERGVRLSGGQRQRIGIARALYHDPEVLILDEATSALDNLTERAVMDAVHNLGNAKTIIMIAHRLTTVRDCDTIFLLEKGRVAAQGRYDDLVAGNETFRRMVGT